MPRRTYPPVGHILRHLRMRFELVSERELVGSMPVTDDLRDPGGAPRMGAIATFVDVAAGTFGHEVVRPDWLATTDMRVLVSRASRADSVAVQTTTVRSGRRSVMTRSVLSDDDGEVGRAWVTYARLPRRDDTPDVITGSGVGRQIEHREPDEAERTRLPFDEYLGLHVSPESSAGMVVLTGDHHPAIHNSFGSLQGGAGAAFVEMAALTAAERRWGGPARVLDLHTYYLGQTRAGPFRVTGDVAASSEAELVVEARVLDSGNDDKLLDLGTAVARPIDSARPT